MINKSIPLPFKKLSPKAVRPYKKYIEDAGFDFTVTRIDKSKKDEYIQYHTDIALEIPTGYVGLLFPRSSVTKKDLMLKNAVGVIDATYRGEIVFRFWGTKIKEIFTGITNYSYGDNIFEVGDRCGQIVILPLPMFHTIEKEELSVTTRGEGGFGTTGK